MRRPYLYGLGLVLLVFSAVLILWQGSFTFGQYAPSSPEQTFLYWAVSTLVFLLAVTLGFMLFRTAARLYIERRKNIEGSRIKTKLVVGALALSFMPVFFLVLWSVYVLNRNLDKWFSGPAEGVRHSLSNIISVEWGEARAQADEQTQALAAAPALHNLLAGRRGSFESLCRQQEVAAAEVMNTAGTVIARCGADRADIIYARRQLPVLSGGQTIGYVLSGVRASADLTAVTKYIGDYDRLAAERKNIRNFYLILLGLITLFVLFFATWVALFLAKQISNPISALLDAAGEVRKGNLGYRIEAPAVDELGTLVRAFNAMTSELEANSRELDLRRRFTEAILESIPTGVISVAADGRIARVNRAFRRMFSDERVASASRLEDLFSRDDTAELKYMMKRARRTGASQQQLEFKGRHGSRQLLGHRGRHRGEAHLRLRHRARRYQRPAPDSEARRVARSGAPNRARNQESADSHRPVQRPDRPADQPPDAAVRSRAYFARVYGHHRERGRVPQDARGRVLAVCPLSRVESRPQRFE